MQQRRRCPHLGFDFRARRADVFQSERHVLVDGHVRVERVGLEDHRQPALRRRNVVDAAAIDSQLTFGHGLEPRDHPQQRRLAATGRTDEDDEFSVFDAEVDALYHRGRAETLDDVDEFETGHLRCPIYLMPAEAMPVVM